MFQRHHQKQAALADEKELAHWRATRDWYAQLVALARQFDGVGSDALMLAAGEALYFSVAGASLIEERRGAGHYEGRSQGVSVPIGHVAGRPVRYRVGTSKGHFVQGAPHPTAIDTGTAFVTNRRVVFQGANQTRQCDFGKLIGIQRSDGDGTTTLSVTNRQKPTTIAYGTAVAPEFDFRLDLALAHFKGTLATFTDQLAAELSAVEASRPAPAGRPGAGAAGGA